MLLIPLNHKILLLQDSNRKLTEANEEMHAQVLNHGLEEGKAILFTHDTAKANLESMSIARELEGLSDSQVKCSFIAHKLVLLLKLKLNYNKYQGQVSLLIVMFC